MTTKAKMNPKDVKDAQYEQKAQLKAVEEKIYQTMEVSTLLTQLTEQKERIEDLKKHMAEIEKESKREREVSLIASRKQEQDLEDKINAYEKLTEELALTKKQYEDKLVALAAQKDEEMAAFKAEMNISTFNLGKRINELNEELRKLNDFKERQEEYYSQVDQLQKKCDELTHDHHDDLKRLDSLHSKALQKETTECNNLINKIRLDAKKGAEQEVEILERKVIEDNKKLQLDLLNYKKEVEALRREKENAIGENKQIKQNISLQEDGALEYQAIHFRQESKIRKLKEKVQVLKNYIAQEVNKHTKELEASKYQFQVRVTDLEMQNQTMRDELKLKVKESKNLKALSQIILDQRSEIEEFLLETLDHVKEEVKRQKMSEKRTKLPEITSSRGKLETKPKKNWEKIDFTGLDWEDKEKILRILFSKMNTGILPANWRTASFERSSDATGQSMHAINANQHSTL